MSFIKTSSIKFILDNQFLTVVSHIQVVVERIG